MPTRRILALLLALRRAAADREIADRLSTLVLLILWAQVAAASGRNDHRPPWMRLAAPRAPHRPVRRAGGSTAGRRPRG